MAGFNGRGLFLVLIALAVLMPGLALIPVSLAIALQCVLGSLNLFAGLPLTRTRPDQGRTAGTEAIFFSVHLAIHEEPPALVARTLRALARMVDAPDHEVIVLDNNTADHTLWRPVEALCRELGPRFRFYHEDGVRGAKAGALNIALERSSAAATHIVVVDADYEVAPDFLAVAAHEIGRQDNDFIQFPQAYRNDSGPVAGVSLELADYFLRHAARADVADAMLLTGTLSVIRRCALEASGGWSGRTITEDAELGLRLHRLGFRGRFVDRPVGRGLLPLDLAGLSLQRYRWAAGNLHVIGCGLAGLRPRAAIQVFSQLTAWTNMALPLAAGLIGGGLAQALGVEARVASLLTSLCGLGLVEVYLSICLPMILAAIVRRRPLRIVLGALSARVALIVPSALATADALLGRTGGFRRTAKDAQDATDGVGRVLPALALSGLLLLVAVPGLPWGGVTGAVLLILPFPLALGTQARLAAYRMSLPPA